MKFNLANIKEAEEAFKYLTELVGKETVAEVTKVSPHRSLNQNSYLHLALSMFALHFNWTAEEAKWLYKKLNKDIFFYRKNDEIFVRSTTKINKEDMAVTIDRFITYAGEQGFEIPPATNQEWLIWAGNEAERNKKYL